MMSRVLAVTLALGIVAQPGSAQVLNGAVVDSHGRAIVGALLDVIGTSGATELQVLTDSLGSFSIPVRDTGRYTIRVSRVGYAPWDSGITAGGLSGPGILLRAGDAALPALGSDDVPAVCGAPAAGSPAARLIADGQTALAMVRATSTARLLTLAIQQFERRLSRQRRIQDSTVTSGIGGAWPLATFAEAQLRETGFVLVRPDETWVYASPGPESLFSDWLVERHCWSIVGAPHGMSEVALDFAPRGTEGPLSGRMLFDRATGTLRSVEWLYERMPRPELRRVAGGSFELERLPSGPWFVRRWQVHIPSVERDSRGAIRVAGWVERGGRVVQVLPGHDTEPADRQP